MITLKPTTATNQVQNQEEEYRIEVKNGVEYFYKHCEQCGSQ